MQLIYNCPLPEKLSQSGPEVMSTSPLLLSGEHILPINKIVPVVCSLIRIMKGWVAVNSFEKLTAVKVIPVTAAASVPAAN